MGEHTADDRGSALDESTCADKRGQHVQRHCAERRAERGGRTPRSARAEPDAGGADVNAACRRKGPHRVPQRRPWPPGRRALSGGRRVGLVVGRLPACAVRAAGPVELERCCGAVPAPRRGSGARPCRTSPTTSSTPTPAQGGGGQCGCRRTRRCPSRVRGLGVFPRETLYVNVV